MKSNSLFLVSVIVLFGSTFAIGALAAPPPKVPQDVNVTNIEAHQPIVKFGSALASGVDRTGLTGWAIASPLALLSVYFIIEFDPAISDSCSITLKRDVLDTPAGSDPEIIRHNSYTSEMFHHTFARPILLTENLVGALLFEGADTDYCWVRGWVTLGNP